MNHHNHVRDTMIQLCRNTIGEKQHSAKGRKKKMHLGVSLVRKFARERGAQ